VDPHDPQAAEVALLAAAADERVLQRGVDRFLRGAIQLALVGVVALREPKQFLPLGATDGSSFDAGHLCDSWVVGSRFAVRQPTAADPMNAVICTAASARASPRRRPPRSSSRAACVC